MKKVAAIQMTSSDNIEQNLREAERLITLAADFGASLVVLPEMFALLGAGRAGKLDAREEIGNGHIQAFLAQQAAKYSIWIVGGTVAIRGNDPEKFRSASFVYNNLGRAVAHYDKMHLFDASVRSGEEPYLESALVEPGNELVVIDTPVGRLGLGVCYDVRFPEFFRSLFARGAEVFAVPSAFTVSTGEAHWEVLLRARAIENFAYVIGAGQWGLHSNGRKTYGNSMIVDPWGRVAAHLPTGSGVIVHTIDLDYLNELRHNFPVKEHQRIFCDTFVKI